jgi:hypothetical protein
MVVRNKFYKLIERYRGILKEKQKKFGNGASAKSVKSKNIILDFYLRNNRWPSRLSKNKREKQLASRFENYISKENKCYDSNLRRIALVAGRKTNHKRKHDIEGFKKEILKFIEDNGRVPSPSRKHQILEGEATLRHRLDYYTLDKNDTTFLGKVYDGDKCHRSGIPSKYRAIINKALDVEKPLIRLV